MSMLSFNSTHPRILNHSPIAVGERLVLVVTVQLGFYLQEGNRHFVVRNSLPLRFYLKPFLDFLTVRKIPLKEHPYITENQQQHQEEETRSDDPNVTLFLNKVRAVLKTDRAIHDLVVLLLIRSKLHPIPFIFCNRG